MLPLVFAFVLLQHQPCRDAAAPHLASAAERAETFDLAAAADAYFAAAGFGCAEAEIAGHYVRGLAAARDASRVGGSIESLAPVAHAMAAIEARRAAAPSLAPIARLVLEAAAAAAQSERGAMSLLLEQAIRLEGIQLEAGQPGLPAVTAHEAAGDLWLQVHGFDEARRAYEHALARVGPTPRVTLGLARVAVRLEDDGAACVQYQALVDWWGTRADGPPEIAEARAYLADQSCPVRADDAAPLR